MAPVMEGNREEAVKQFQEDEFFKHFIHEEFDVKQHLTEASAGLEVADQLTKLTEGIVALNKEIHSQVSNHHEDLLCQATGIDNLKGVLSVMQSRTQVLLSGVERMRSRLLEPYTKMAAETTMLSRLQDTCNLVRRVTRILQLSAAIQQAGNDLPKLANILSEVDAVCAGFQLNGLEMIQAEMNEIQRTRDAVIPQAKHLLTKGLKQNNHSQVATGVSVFHSLGQLDEVMAEIHCDIMKELQTKTANSFNVHSLISSDKDSGPAGRVVVASPGSGATIKAAFWASLEKVIEEIQVVAVMFTNLQRVLARKRIGGPNNSYLDALSSPTPMHKFLDDLKHMLKEQISKSAQEMSFIRITLEAEYPKLLRLFLELSRRIRNLVESLVVDSPLTTVVHPEAALRDVVSPYEAAYVGKSQQRMLDPLNLMFSQSHSLPQREEIDTWIKTLSSELNVAAFDEELNDKVTKTVEEALHVFSQKAKQLSQMDDDALQVAGSPTPSALVNWGLVNHLEWVGEAAGRLSKSSAALQKGVSDCRSTAESISKPWFHAANDALLAIILTMPSEDFSGCIVQPDKNPSLYMLEMNQFLDSISCNHLSHFSSQRFLNKRVKDIVERCVELFVRHTCLLRPIGAGGKAALIKDTSMLELYLGKLHGLRGSELEELTQPLKHLKQVLEATTNEELESLGGYLFPHSTLIHFLFSAAWPDLRSPFQVCGWNEGEYSGWLDEHTSERERLTLLNTTLEAYVTQVRRQGGTKFDPVYPHMLKLLENGMQQHKVSP